MAGKKRKSTSSTARKAVKKTTARMQTKAQNRKSKTVGSKKSTVTKVARPSPITSVDKAFTKGQLFTTLASRLELKRSEVSAFFDELTAIIAAHMKKQGPQQFTIPGLVKITVKHRPATKARQGVNPFTGEKMMFKAKPARNIVKIRPLLQLKEMV